ncbi:MAG: indole-3-glycerol phosphate synthase TrpC [Alphaproteobacteria bacterium]|nr:indole-3-glycerol phosphate synthase TrpC [Alphaproteobacteria bacterium]
MADTLSEICAAKRQHIQRRKQERSEAALLEEARHAGAARGFRQALCAKQDAGAFGLIAEIKKASPSRGVIRADFSPPKLAEAYAQGGAACLSVLTDEPFFQGYDDFLRAAREACELPVLRKDFMLEPYQIIESRALGADCVLLILAALGDAQYAELFAAARSLALDVLVEVHDERELERALTRASPDIVGINNRDLRSFKTDLSVSETLARHLPEPILKISESGIRAYADLTRLAESGIRCFLVGESLMREQDVAAATQRLLNGTV